MRAGADPVVEPLAMGPRLRGDDNGVENSAYQSHLKFESVPETRRSGYVISP